MLPCPQRRIASLRAPSRVALLLALAASPALLKAQFQQPTAEELKMTSDPKAPGASAVYLYYSEITDFPADSIIFYDRIKVLTEKGKDLATVRIPYEPFAGKITSVEGRTVHADGGVVPLTDKPTDLVSVKTKDFQQNTLTFTLPSVEVGSILEYRVTFHGEPFPGSALTWHIQKPYFIHQEHFSYRASTSGFTGLMYAAYLPIGATIMRDKTAGNVLDISDVQPEPDEDWMPPLNTLRWRVQFYYTTVKSGKEFWDGAQKNWAEGVREFTNPSGRLKKAVGDIVAPGDSDEQKATKIYSAVMKLENTDFTHAKSEAERKKDKLKEINKAEDIWKNQGGSGDEIALLYVALARAAGLNAVPMKVVDRSRALFDSSYLYSFQLDDYIAVLQLGGKDVFLDPGEKMCPFGLLHWKHSLATGFRLADKDAVIASTPPASFKDAAVHRSGDLTIDPTGGVSGTIRILLSGQSALRWRQLALINDEQEVRKQFNESIRSEIPQGVQADFDHFIGLADFTSDLMGIVHVSGTLGTVTGKRIFVPGLFFQSRGNDPFVAQDKRTVSVDVQYPRLEQDDIDYSLPPGFSVESQPQSGDQSWPNHAQLKIRSTPGANSVSIQRVLVYNFTLLLAAQYTSLHDFYQKVATADQQQLVIARAPAVKGN